MVMFGLNTAEIQNGYDNAAATPYIPERDSAPSWYEGAGTALETGFYQGGVEAGMLFADKSQEPAIQQMLDELKPKPETTGWLGNVLQGVGSVIPPAAAGTLAAWGNPLGGALAVGEIKGYAKMQELQSQGVDEATAATVGTIEGITQGAGVILPASTAGRLATRAATGAGINAGLGMTQRGATGSILEANGYKDMADQYRVLDGMALLTDTILGAGFGVAHLPSEVDAGLAANSIHHLEIDSAPGIPADIATRNAHIEAMDTALSQAARGEPIHVDLPEANFLAKEPRPEAREMAEAFDEHAQDIMTPEQAREVFTPKPIENPYADISAKVERMDPEMQSARLESLNRKMEAAIITPKEMFEREALSAKVASPTSSRLKLIQNDADGQLFYVLDDKGRDVGAISTKEKNGHTSIIRAGAGDESVRGKGYFAKAYRELADRELASGKELHSDQEVSASAAKLYKSLERKGYIVSKDPMATVDAGGNLLSNNRNPVFKVTARPNTKGIPKPQITEKSPKTAEDSVIASSKQIAMAKPEMKVMTEDGPVTAMEAVAKAEADKTQVEKEASVFDAAINCFLRFG